MSKTRTAIPCKWHSVLLPAELTGDYMGGSVNLEHTEWVRAEREKRLRFEQPDSYLVAGNATEKVLLVDFLRESYSCKQWYLENGHKGHDTFHIKGPVLPVHLSKIADFLYTGAYGLSVDGLLEYPVDYRGYETGCAVCDDTYRMLCFHHGLFHAARSLQMENLQRRCIKNFVHVLEETPPPLVRLVVHEVYSVRPHVSADQLEDVFTLGEIWDYREKFVRSAVTKWLHNPQQEDLSQGSKAKKPLTFEDLRVMHADFDKHFAKWEQQGLSPHEPPMEW
ncbi:hypothetical protein N7493_008577 [Penicillium malachiteum]|uniref:Uncharacterized protein n=1 Tax=Penicillium malachiteum TaxID=1324776 RepID=A0AAD6MTX0_9EURO|nr:hypothetical protein N7493_008577 [Penicillium malachiteum]